MTHAQAAALACVMSIACQGCAGASEDGREAAVVAPIIDGEPSGSDEDGVLLIRAVLEDQREVICTASLVGANLLVTARHCVSYLQEGAFTCSVRGELNNSGTDAGRLGLHIPATSIDVYGGDVPRKEPLAHGRQILSTLSETICSNDLAFIVLDRELELPLVPMRIGRSAEVGEPVVMVGYGLQRGQDSLDYETQPRMRKAGLVIAGVGPDSVEDGVTTVAPRSLIVDAPSGCIGDSGGPALAEATGALLGVYSLQQGDSCTSAGVRNHLVHVPPFERLIADAFAAAGTEPLLEPEPSGGAGGEAGAGSVAAGGQGGDGSALEPSGGDDAHRKSSGCAFSRDHESEGAHAAVVALWSLAMLGRRFSGDRRADRKRA